MLTVEANNIGLVMHKLPDGDALGACAALVDVFKQKYPNKKVYIISDYPFDLKYANVIPKFKDNVIKGIQIPENTHIFILDHNCRDISLLRDGRYHNIKAITIIDHHHKIIKYNQELQLPVEPDEFIDTNVKSTCELLFDYLKDLNSITITPDIATYLYLGIHSDSLRYNNCLEPDLIEKIYLLSSKYKARVKEATENTYGKGFLYLLLTSRLYFRQVTKKKNLKTAIVTIKLADTEKFKPYGVTSTAICSDLLATRNTDFVICKQEKAQNRWVLKVITKVPGAMKQLFGAIHRDESHTTEGMSKEQIDLYEKNILRVIKEIVGNQKKEEIYKYAPD